MVAELSLDRFRNGTRIEGKSGLFKFGNIDAQAGWLWFAAVDISNVYKVAVRLVFITAVITYNQNVIFWR